MSQESLCVRAQLREDHDVVQVDSVLGNSTPGEPLACDSSAFCFVKKIAETAFGRQIDYEVTRCVQQIGGTPTSYLSPRQ